MKQLEPIPGYDFDISKTEAIFDMLVKEKLLVPLPRHQTPTTEEMRGRKYCKWHNKLDGHNTGDCRILRSEIQKAIEQGRLVFASAPMKIDTMPFPVNAIYAASPLPDECYSEFVSESMCRVRLGRTISTGRILHRGNQDQYFHLL